MNWKTKSNNNPYGVIGAGSFGTAIANILAENGHVLIYTRRAETFDAFKAGKNRKQTIHENVEPTQSLEELCQRCTLIFPMVPSASFRDMIRTAAPYLLPHHLLIHGTKGLNVQLDEGQSLSDNLPISREHIHTMSDIIINETVVLRVGCLSGPNLAMELADKQPAATVVASRFNEVVEAGRDALKSNRFRVYGSNDILGVELAGVLKNVMAIASGISFGLNFGENAKAMLITRGLGEIVKIGQALGADTRVFFGIAGIGDLIATCSSQLSRNFTVGKRLALGESLDYILDDMQEVVEGIRTIQIANSVAQYYRIEAPIVRYLYKILFENVSIKTGLAHLMKHDFDTDVDFWENV